MPIQYLHSDPSPTRRVAAPPASASLSDVDAASSLGKSPDSALGWPGCQQRQTGTPSHLIRDKQQAGPRSAFGSRLDGARPMLLPSVSFFFTTRPGTEHPPLLHSVQSGRRISVTSVAFSAPPRRTHRRAGLLLSPGFDAALPAAWHHGCSSNVQTIWRYTRYIGVHELIRHQTSLPPPCTDCALVSLK